MKYCQWCFEPLSSKPYNTRFCTRKHAISFNRDRERAIMYQKAIQLLGSRIDGLISNLSTYLENRNAVISYIRRLGFKWDNVNQNWIPGKRINKALIKRLQSG